MTSFLNSEHVDLLKTCIEIYGDSSAALYASAECVYAQEHGGKLPNWACYIERVDIVNDSYIFVHKDRSKVL